MHYRAVDATFSEPMGEGALTASNYSITAGAGTLSLNPAKVIRITPSIYRLIWTSGDMAISGTVTIQVASSVKDVAGNAVTGTLSRSSTGTKRVIGVNCGNNALDVGDENGWYFQYAPPFVSDSGFQGNEPAAYLTSGPDPGHYYTYSTTESIDTSGVTDPAPQAGRGGRGEEPRAQQPSARQCVALPPPDGDGRLIAVLS